MQNFCWEGEKSIVWFSLSSSLATKESETESKLSCHILNQRLAGYKQQKGGKINFPSLRQILFNLIPIIWNKTSLRKEWAIPTWWTMGLNVKISDLWTKRFCPSSLEGLREKQIHYCQVLLLWNWRDCSWCLWNYVISTTALSVFPGGKWTLTLSRHFNLLYILIRHRGNPFTFPIALYIFMFVISCVKTRPCCGLERTLQYPWLILPINNVSPIPVSLIFLLFNYAVLV